MQSVDFFRNRDIYIIHCALCCNFLRRVLFDISRIGGIIILEFSK